VSPSLFGLFFAVAAALLALWILVRFASFGPRTILWAVIQTLIACVLLQLVVPAAFAAIDARALPGTVYLQVFGVALPFLVYAFLAGGWVTRLALSQLR
jgi:hypothetical protein